MGAVDSLNSSFTAIGDIWSCEVTPNDGFQNGNTDQSNNITINAALSHLAIWDETNTITKYTNEQVRFYANYTNITGDYIEAANCTVWFNDTLVWSNMTWNASSSLYEYNRSFNTAGSYDWNVSCNKTGYNTNTRGWSHPF